MMEIIPIEIVDDICCLGKRQKVLDTFSRVQSGLIAGNLAQIHFINLLGIEKFLGIA